MEKRLLNIGEAANALGVSKDSVRRLIQRDLLRSVRVLRRVMVPTDEVTRICETGTVPLRLGRVKPAHEVSNGQ